MDSKRRTVLQGGAGAGLLALLAGVGLLKPSEVFAARANDAAFKLEKLDEVLKALGVTSAAEGGDIVLTAPDIAENGAVVPVELESKLPNTESVMVLIEKNPTPLAAIFHFHEGALPRVKTRVKMGQSSDVYLLVKADGKFYQVKKEIKVTLGGCGG
ncbi:MAG: thiosulfate oxidation carrier protein SoxY [Rhodocyclales bacterium]|nr:thiosulfate oxidation carrier protein SoxY [Rhodocyclales bacterium]